MDNTFDRFGPYREEFARPLISPDSLLEDFIDRVLRPMKTVDPQMDEEGFYRWEDRQDQGDRLRPPVRVNPADLNLEEYRRPGPSYPSEPLQRLQFLLSPRSPLT
jgi:hypothetical protein